MSEDIFGEIIYAYSRKQAIEDGVLIDISEIASEAGFKFPVAVTDTVYHQYIIPPSELEGLQDVQGRLWDMLVMLNHTVRNAKAQDSIIYFSVRFLMKLKKYEDVQLKAVCGPGDDGEAVITIMFPQED